MGVSSAKAGWAVVLGVLAVATLPVAVLLTRYSASYDLLHAGFAIPLGLGFGAAAIWWARQVRDALRRDAGAQRRPAGRLRGTTPRHHRDLHCVARALIALAVYGVLSYLGSQS